METERTIDVLNKLVEINNDRIQGYDTASDNTQDLQLKAMFAEFSRTSFKCKNELATEISRLGGKPSEGTRVSGKFYRAWMDIKTALTSNDRKNVLDLCEHGEDAALETYEDVLKDDREYLSVAQLTMINSQEALLREDHNRVKSMRDVAA